MLKGYKVIIINTLTALVAISQVAGFTDLLNPSTAPYVVLAVGIANVVLRFFTDTKAMSAT